MTTSDIIATCSAFVAVFALFATGYQAWLARKHNRLSVRPWLVWHIARHNSDETSRIVLSIKNLGLGPAIVKDRYFTKDDIRFNPPGLKTDEVQDFLKHLIGNRLPYKLNTFGLPGRNAAILQNTEVVVADISVPGRAPAALANFEELAGKVSFRLLYESMYGEPGELHQE